MDRTAGATLRWTRAGLLTAVAMVSGTIAHRSAGGILPGPVALVVLFVVATALVAPLLAGPATTLRVVGLMMAGQTFVHGALTALSGHRGDPPLQRRAPTLSYTPPVPVPAPVQHVLADLTGPHAAMALAHLAAAAVVGLWLAVGERALWTILALVADSTRFVVSAAAASYVGSLGVVAGIAALTRSLRGFPPDLAIGRLPRRSQVLERIVVRRGPPPAAA